MRINNSEVVTLGVRQKSHYTGPVGFKSARVNPPLNDIFFLLIRILFLEYIKKII